MFPQLPKGDQTKLLKFFWLKIFSICHRCQRHRWQTLGCEYLCEFSKKFETVLTEYSGAGGKLIHEKNQKQKISWHCPFNARSICTINQLCVSQIQESQHLYLVSMHAGEVSSFINLKGKGTIFLTSAFFTVSPKSLNIQRGPFQFFFKNWRRYSQL